MANPALIARSAAQVRWPGAVVVERGKGHIKHKHPTLNQFMLDTQVGGVGWHYGPSNLEVDTAWVAGGAPAPFNYRMEKADFNAYLQTRLDAAFVGRYTDPTTGEYVEFDPQNLQWTNDLNQIQPISTPGAINAVINDDLATWPNGYGPGRHFSWQAQTARFEKLLTIDSLASLPTANATIRSGGNPALELQLTIRRSAGVQIWINGVLWNEAGNNDRSTSGLVEFRQTSTGQVLWWFNLPRSWDSAGQEVVGTFWFKRAGQSLNVFHRIPLVWIEDAARVWPIKVDVTVDVQVGAIADNNFVRYATSSWFSSQVELRAGNADAGTNKGYGGDSRFTSVNVPSGATVSVCYVTWTAYADASGTVVRSDLHFENSNNPSTTTSFANYDGRTKTTKIEWDSIAAWTQNTEYQSPSLATPLQTVVDAQGGTGSAVIIFWQDKDIASDTAALRRAYSYKGSTTKAPKLHIEYTAGGGGPRALGINIPRLVMVQGG